MNAHIKPPAHGLTGKLGEIADVVGVAAALELVRALGGHEIKLSARPTGKLASIVGLDAAIALVDAMGAAKITVPMANLKGQAGRRAAAARLLDSGASVSEAAGLVDIHERTAFRVKLSLKSTGSLFDD